MFNQDEEGNRCTKYCEYFASRLYFANKIILDLLLIYSDETRLISLKLALKLSILIINLDPQRLQKRKSKIPLFISEKKTVARFYFSFYIDIKNHENIRSVIFAHLCVNNIFLIYYLNYTSYIIPWATILRRHTYKVKKRKY